MNRTRRVPAHYLSDRPARGIALPGLKRFLLAALVTLCLLAILHGTPWRIELAGTALAASQSRPVTLTHQDTERTYHLYVPPALANGGRRAPLVLVLHGGGGRGTQIEWATRYRFNILASEHQFLVAYPDGMQRGWNDGRRAQGKLRHRADINDTGFLEQVVDHVAERLPVNPKRVFVTGMSNGAMMSLRLACQSNRFSAVAAVAGNLPEPLTARCQAAGKNVLLIQGVDDAIVPYAGGYVSGIRPGNKRGRVLSAKQTFALLGKANGCQATREIPIRDLFPDGTTVTRHRYTGCTDRTVIEQWRILGGGHAWPGGRSRAPRFLIGNSSRELDATTEIWRFFSQHSE